VPVNERVGIIVVESIPIKAIELTTVLARGI